MPTPYHLQNKYFNLKGIDNYGKRKENDKERKI
jgi:hypothetical protein